MDRIQSHRGVIWEHELPNEIEYNQEKPFFHTWQGDVRPAPILSHLADETIIGDCDRIRLCSGERGS